jgi:uncharacterized delta-60 repeat protein
MNRVGRGFSVFILAVTLAVMSVPAAVAFPGELDTAFSGDGKAATDFTTGDDFAWDVAIQSDEMIVAAGRAGGSGGRFALVRYEASGPLDSTFSGDGKVTTNFTSGSDVATSVGIQSDGKIVAAGAVGGSGGRFGLARYNPNGSLDTTFGGDGRVTTNFTTSDDFAWDVAIQPDGAIVAAGAAGGSGGRFALVRYDATGALDTTFGGDGKVTTNFTTGFDGAFGMGIQSDGAIVAAGTAGGGGGGQFALVRYNTDGTLDTSFGGDGKVTTNFGSGSDFATSMAIQSNGNIVAVGPWATGDGRFAAARYDTAGALDSTFSGDGKFTWDFSDGGEFMWDVAIQSDGKIVVAGFVESGALILLARFLADGTFDPNFGLGEGTVYTNFTSGIDVATSVTVQPDGKIVVGARVDGSGGRFGVARYLAA